MKSNISLDNKVLKIVDPKSSYLTDLAKEELKSYEHFTEEYDTKYLSGFNQKRIYNNLLKKRGEFKWIHQISGLAG